MAKGSMKILQIDDKMVTTDLDRAGYRKMGAEVKVVTSFDQASKMLDSDAVDIVVVNMDFKKVNAAMICQHLKQTRKDLPVVLTTEMGSAKNRNAALAAGTDLFVVLPIPRQSFIEKLKQLLDKETRSATERVGVGSEARFSVDGHHVTCPIGDLSISGILLHLPVEILTGTQIDISFDVPGYKKPIEAFGEVVRILKKVSGDEGLFGIGVRFAEFKGDSQKRLEKYVQKTSHESSSMLYYL